MFPEQNSTQYGGCLVILGVVAFLGICAFALVHFAS